MSDDLFEAFFKQARVHGTLAQAQFAYQSLVPEAERKRIESQIKKTPVVGDIAREGERLQKLSRREQRKLKRMARKLPSTAVHQGRSLFRRQQKTAGLSLSGLFVSKERRQARKRVEDHHRRADPEKWDEFLDRVKRKSFAKTMMRDSRTSEKDARHADQMNRLMTGRKVDTFKGATGTYDIIRLRGGGYGCSCPDWRYRRSVSPKGTQDCKHLKQWKSERSKKTWFRRMMPKKAAASTFGEGIAMMLRKPGWAKKYNSLASKRMQKLLTTEIPGTKGIHLPGMNKQKAEGLARQLSHPETAVQVALPFSFAHMPVTEMVKRKMPGLPKGVSNPATRPRIQMPAPPANSMRAVGPAKKASALHARLVLTNVLT